MLSGDSLFVGDIARPDLAVDKEDGARGIYGSLHRLLELGDDVEVWPGHLGGSLCGGPAIDLKVSSTVGYERRHNELLGVEDEDAFVARSTANLRPQPPNFKSIVAINRGPLERRPIDIEPLTPRQIQQADAPVIDVRTAQQFDDAHIPGAICNTILQSGFGTRLAWIAGPDQEVVLVGRDDADALHAAELAAAVGVGRIAGYLAGGMTSWREERLPVESIARITVPELHERADEVQILDVRERDEWESGHIPDSVFKPYHDIHALPEGLDPAGPDRGDLRLRPARRGRRQPRPALRRPRGAARGRRRCAGLGPARLAARDLSGHGGFTGLAGCALASTHGSSTPSRPARLRYDTAPGL